MKVTICYLIINFIAFNLAFFSKTTDAQEINHIFDFGGNAPVGPADGDSQVFGNCGNFKVTYHEFGVGTGVHSHATGSQGVGSNATPDQTSIAADNKRVADNNQNNAANVSSPVIWVDYIVVRLNFNDNGSNSQCFYPSRLESPFMLNDIDGARNVNINQGTREIGAMLFYNNDTQIIPDSITFGNRLNFSVATINNAVPASQLPAGAVWPPSVNTYRATPTAGDTNPAGTVSRISAFFTPEQCITDAYFLWGLKDLGNNTNSQGASIDFKIDCGADYGDAPAEYGTLTGDNGPAHLISDYTVSENHQLSLGDDVSYDAEPVLSITPESDTGDEAMVAFPGVNLSEPGTQTYTLNNIKVVNTTGAEATLCGWIDFDLHLNLSGNTGDGTFDSNESVCVTVPASGDNADCTVNTDGSFNCSLSWIEPIDFFYNPTQATFSRLRLAPVSEGMTEPSGIVMGGEVEDYEIPASTLPVTLSHFETKFDRYFLHYRWQTDSELSNLGFNLWLKQDNRWRRVNKNLIAGKLNSIEMKNYQRVVRIGNINNQAPIEYVAISSVSVSGKEEMYGPYEPGRSYGYVGEPPEPVDWTSIAKEMEERLNESGYIKVGQNYYHERSKKGKGYNEKSRGHGLLGLLTIKDFSDGLVKVSNSELAGAGIDLNGQEINAIALTRLGKPVAVDIIGVQKGRWTENSALIFYNAGLNTASADVSEMVYQLSLSYEDHLLAGKMNTIVSEAVSKADIVKVSENEEQLSFDFDASGSDPWVAKSIYYYEGSTNGAYIFSYDLSDVRTGSGDMKVDFYADYEDPEKEIDGSLTLFKITDYGDVELGSAEYSGSGHHQLHIAIEETLLADGENRFRLKLSTSNEGKKYAYITLDKTQLSYDAYLDNTNSSYDVFVQKENESAANYDAASVSSDSRVYVVMQHDQSILLVKPVSGQIQTLTDDFGDLHYHIVREGGYQTAVIDALAAPDAQTVATGSADYLIITHPLFRAVFESGAGAAFINAKQNAGHQVSVVDYSDVIQVSGYGESGQATLSRYIQQQKENNDNLQYILLVGAACRDARNYSGEDCVNMIPTKYVSSETTNFTPSDFRLGDVDNDGYAEVIVGRLPARTQDELSNILHKINTSENDRLSRTVRDVQAKSIFSADQFDITQNLSFSGQQERVKSLMSEQNEHISVYADEGGTRLSLISALNEGADLWSFSGHSSMYSLGGAVRLFNTGDGGKLTNQRYPMALPMSCYMTYSVHESVNTLSYQLMNTKSGVSGVFGSAVLTSFADNEILQKEVIRLMQQSGLNLGEAILQGQYVLSAASSTLSGANLMGDPAYRF